MNFTALKINVFTLFNQIVICYIVSVHVRQQSFCYPFTLQLLKSKAGISIFK